MRTERELGDGCSTFAALVVLERLEGHEGAGAGDQLVGELGLVVRLLDLVVVVLGVVCIVANGQRRLVTRGTNGMLSAPKPNMFAVSSWVGMWIGIGCGLFADCRSLVLL